jgi:phage-related baseplate assembly protein
MNNSFRFSRITPISPPTGPATGSSNGLHPKSNFLAFINDGAAALKKRIAANLSTFSVAGSDGSIKS